ncbi:hypothetical protein SB00610_03430 [Klebsiella quasipneumoniae subsp. similipneumoniae]|nr:hypothetical protein SB00610_03430 [Klebsiella quasipneumoniae subsp. similipneumoniae]
MQNVLQLRLTEGMQRRLPIMLTNIIAHRLTVIALAEQIAELRQGLAMMMIVLRGG